MKKNIILSIISLFIIFVSYYLVLPPINISSFQFWGYFVIISLIISILFLVCNMDINKNIDIIAKKRKSEIPKLLYFILILIVLLPLISIVNIFGGPLFNASSYYERISVESGDFTSDIKPVDFNSLALLDKDSSTKLGDRVMGQLTDLVSQFYVSTLYTQITYQDTIMRVTPLEYDGIIKYFTNKDSGIPGYITVNSVNGESTLTRLEQGMKYMPSAYFGEDLYRRLRFDYLFENFGEATFELDDEGNPYWIIPTIKYSLVGLKPATDGLIIFNPVDGTSTKYDINEVPTWVDHVYSSDLVISQLSDWGAYKNGFLNSVFGQKEVVMPTEGYNYLTLNGDVYLYTGITSVASDESNIGFVMANLRTKETKIYNVAGAEEYSAMDSAKGQVQHLNYTSTFPLLINLNEKPTYLMSLKDNAGLVKMYALVDYTDYQIVSVTDSSLGIQHAVDTYLGDSFISTGILENQIDILNITTAVLDGNTFYYFKTSNGIYKANLKINETVLPFIMVGDVINIKYQEGSVNEIIEITN